MDLKKIIVSLVYLMSVVLLAVPKFIGVFARGGAAAVLGTVLILALTGLYGGYIYTSAVRTYEPAPLPLPKATAPESYAQLAEWFRCYQDLGGCDNSPAAQQVSSDLASAYRDGVINDNPFRNTPLGSRMQETVLDISVKYDQTVKILSESFDPNDITYQNYLSVLDNVLKLSTAHLKSIKKRVCVFDYREWASGHADAMCQQYISEVGEIVGRLEEIGDKFDHLIHELVCLDEISEAPLLELQTLIETTSDYKSIDEQ